MASDVGPVSGFLSTRGARRRGIAYVLLVASTLLLMAISSSPPVLELQKGIGFAFRPIQSFMADLARGTGVVLEELDSLSRVLVADTYLRPPR